MTEEIVAEIRHIQEALEMWEEAKWLYSGTTAMDWTLTITVIVTTCYTDGKDVSVKDEGVLMRPHPHAAGPSG